MSEHSAAVIVNQPTSNQSITALHNVLISLSLKLQQTQLFQMAVRNNVTLSVCCQGPTPGRCLRPKAPSPREVMATAARTTARAAAFMSTEVTRRCLPTNMASLMTFTAMKSARGHGKSTHAVHMLHCLFIRSPSRCIGRSMRQAPLVIHDLVMHVIQVHPPGERLSSLLALRCASQRHPAHLRRQHTQRHVAQQRGEVLLRRLPRLRYR